jgi:hypothetical protein
MAPDALVHAIASCASVHQDTTAAGRETLRENRMNGSNEKQARGWRRVPWWGLVGVLLFYVLSLGPALVIAAWLDGRRTFGGSGERAVDVVEIIYGPVIWVCDSSPLISDALDWYLEFWLKLL